MLAIAGLAALAAFVFWQPAQIRFLSDDYLYLDLTQRSGWWHSGGFWSLDGTLSRHLLYVWFAILRIPFGLHPVPYHIATGALVVVDGLLVGLVARRLGLRSGALAAAPFFALHGAMGVPIAWASAANSPLSVAFALGAIYLLLTPRPRAAASVGACALLLCGLLTREVVAVTPAVLVLARALVEEGALRHRVQRAAIVSLPLWATLGAYLAARFASGFNNTGGPYEQRIGTHAVENFVALLKFPTNLWAFDRLQPLMTLFWVVLFGLCVLAAKRCQTPHGLIGLAWAFLGLLPTTFLIRHDMESYYVDFALVGVAIAVGTSFELVCRWLPRRRCVLLGSACLLGLVLVGRSTANREVNDYLRPWAARTDGITASIQEDHPDYPNEMTDPSIVVHFDGEKSVWLFLTHWGDMLRVYTGNPDLIVYYEPSEADADG
jgi:hypothetical protein